MKITLLDEYQNKISLIAQILYEKFNQDVLLYFQIHSLKSYECTKNKNFVFTSLLPKQLQGLHQKKYIEFRFFCKSKKNSTLKNKSKKPQFFMIPYADNESPPKLEGQEKFYGCVFEYEFNLKIYPDKFTLKLNSNIMPIYVKKIYSELKKILREVIPAETINLKFHDKISIELPEHEIKQSINRLKEHMNKGDCYLANMTYTQTISEDQFLSYQHFINTWFHLKSRYGIYFDHGKVGLACFSPERFLLCKNNFLISDPIKGTFACAGQKPSRVDAELLWKNRKEIYEHTLVVDLIRNDLNAVCIPGSVQVYQPFQAYVAGKLLQMQTSIFGKKENKTTPRDCFNSMLPAGSVTGTPKKKVCQLIARYEKNTRGFYTGVCGILEPNGDFDSCVLIRSIYKGTRGTYLGVGAGITTLSDTDAEMEEFKVKLNSFLKPIYNRCT